MVFTVTVNNEINDSYLLYLMMEKGVGYMGHWICTFYASILLSYSKTIGGTG